MTAYLIDPAELVFHDDLEDLLLWEDRVGNGVVSFTYTFIQQSYGWPGFYAHTMAGPNNPNPDIEYHWDFAGEVPDDPQNPYELQQAIEDILASPSSARSDFRVSFSDVADIEFSSEAQQGTGVDDVGDISFSLGTLMTGGNYSGSTGPYRDSTNGTEKAAIVFNENTVNLSVNGAKPGYALYFLSLHEIAHALGLMHIDQNPDISDIFESMKYSVMSYTEYTALTIEAKQGGSGGFYHPAPQGLQLLDILALQEQYQSRNYDARQDDNTYDLTPWIAREDLESEIALHRPFLYTIWDGAGIDAMDASGYNDSTYTLPAQIDLRQGKFSSIGSSSLTSPSQVLFDVTAYSGDPDPGNVAIAYYTVIENAIGTKWDDWLIGNAWNNVLSGGDGADKIYGDGASYDTQIGFRGEAGDEEDIYSVQRDQDSAWTPSAADGSGDDVLIGGDDDDTLYGGLGDDVLHGGFNESDIDAATTGWTVAWDSAGQFSGLSDIAYGIDGTDVADYSKVSGVTLAVEKVADGHLTVTKTDTQTQTQWTDHLYSIERVIGTDGSDIFGGAAGAIGSDAPEYDGGKGADAYIIDMSTDTGEIKIVDTGDSGVDRLVFENVSGAVISYVPGTSGSHAKIMFSPEPAQPEDPLVPFLSVEFDMTSSGSVETIEINGELLHRNVFQSWLSSGAWSTATTPGSEVYDPTYNDGSGGTGGGGGMLPTYDSGGQIANMQVRPDVGIRYLNYAYAEEYLHPWVITSYSGGGGASTISFDTYLQSIQMIDGISAEDVRFTVNSSSGNADLTIHIDSVGSSYTIDDFEAGKTITGIAMYDSAMHGWVQGVGSSLQGSSQGSFTGSYTQEYTLSTSSVQVTYFLEAMHFASSPVIDLQDTMTFTGTSANETLYGLDTRGDIIKGLAGNDNIYAYGGNDTLIGGAGYDRVVGGAGDDTYVFESGFGIYNGSSYADVVDEDKNDGTDTIHFGGGITPEDVYGWTDNYGNVLLQLAGSTADTLLIDSTGSASTPNDVIERIERITFDDETVWDWSLGINLNDTDAAHYLYGTNGNDFLNGNGGNDNLYGHGGNDTLIGGAGKDVLYGGDGNDTYIFGTGFGVFTGTAGSADLVSEDENEGTDTVSFEDGITLDDIYSWTDTYGRLYLQLEGSSADTLFIDGDYSSSTGVDVGSFVEYVTFDDATTWDLNAGLHLRNNDTARILYGSAENDIIEGGAANDTLRGFDGDDVLIGHNGTDALWGYDGADTFAFMFEDVGNGIDTLRDFDMTENDVIDISDVLDGGYDPMTDALADFVKFTNSGSHAALSVDLDGAGTTYGWSQIATVYNHNNLDPDVLATNGHLIAA